MLVYLTGTKGEIKTQRRAKTFRDATKTETD
jgi:hypothetical protein